jgi:hypothetical protein
MGLYVSLIAIGALAVWILYKPFKREHKVKFQSMSKPSDNVRGILERLEENEDPYFYLRKV